MKNVVVTGVSSGIGRATARSFADSGWRVFGTVRKQVDADSVTAEIPRNFTAILMDVTSDDDVRAAADTVATALGRERLQGIVNLAGVETVDALAVVPIDDVKHTFDVHVFGALRTAQAFLPLLGSDEDREGPKGRIVNISSVAGRVGFPFFGTYCAAKHAVEGLTESMRREFVHVGVDAILVAPGNVKSGVFEKVRADEHDYIRGTVWEKPVEDFRKLFLDGAKYGWPMSRIVDTIETALTVSRPKAKYVASAERFMNYTAPTLFPKRIVDRVIDYRIKARAKKPVGEPQRPE